jgi:hypothetical protein
MFWWIVDGVLAGDWRTLLVVVSLVAVLVVLLSIYMSGTPRSGVML